MTTSSLSPVVKNPPKSPWLKGCVVTAIAISLVLLALAWLVFPTFLRLLINISTERVRMDGYSMGTTLSDGSYILADKQAYQQSEPQRYDIIVFKFPLDPEQMLIKRVIGLPGETIEIKDGKVIINGVPLEEPYITEPVMYSGAWVVPEGHFFVLGDNRNNSSDSHSWGSIPHENIIAKAVWIYFPLSRFGAIVDTHSSP